MPISQSDFSGYMLLTSIIFICVISLSIYNSYRINQINNNKITILDLKEFVDLQDEYKHMYDEIIITRIAPILNQYFNNSSTTVIKYFKSNKDKILKIIDNYINIMKLENKNQIKSTLVSLNQEQRLALNQINLDELLDTSCKQLKNHKRKHFLSDDNDLKCA